MKTFLLALLGVLASHSAFAGAKTALQWGVDRTVSPWQTCIYDSANVCQPALTMPSTGGPVLLPAGALAPGAAATNLGGGTAQTGILVGNGTSAATAITPGSGVAAALGSPLGASGGIGPVVANNTELSALASTYATSVTRLGYAAAGDAPPIVFTPSGSACSLNAGAGDGGSQVPSSDAKCWVVVPPPGKIDLREWGVVPNAGSSVDAGPDTRAACAYSASSGVTISVPVGQYYLNTLDASGLGAIVLGTGTGPSEATPCNMSGHSSSDYPDTCASDAPYFLLGPHLNRPLVFIRKFTTSALWENLCLSGNRSLQDGWAGGPSGKLYTVQIEDWTSPAIDTSWRTDRVVIRDGYNGNEYVGSGRGGRWGRDGWWQYSGQSTADIALFLNGVDTTLYNPAVGSNAGYGIYIAEGSQYQFTDGATFFNNIGMAVNGAQVNYVMSSGMNFQFNACHGLLDTSTGPFAGSQAVSHMFANAVFDGNNTSGSSTCYDVYNQGNSLLHLSQPAFNGSVTTANVKVPYNIFVDAGIVTVNNMALATTANTTSWTNSQAAIRCSGCSVDFVFTPAITAAGTAGSPAYAARTGRYSISNRVLTLNGQVALSSWAGTPSGAVTITGLPVFSANSAPVGTCVFSTITGWTAASGTPQLSGIVGQNSTTIYLYENASGASATQVQASEINGSTFNVDFTCSYPIVQ